MFDYDAAVPLRVRVIASERREDAVVTEIRYAAARGGDVAAVLVERAAAPADRPGVVYAHGGTAPGKHLFVWQAVQLARAGTTVLLADATAPPTGDADADGRKFADAVLVQRRGLDVLADRGATRFGYFGHSFGATQGAVLSAVEPRLDAVVLAALGTRVVEWFRREGFTHEEYLARVERLDPIHYVGVPRRRRLLFQHGRADDVFPLDAARALFAAAAEPKAWAEYDCDHGVDGHLPALSDRIAFFRDHLVRA